jgi:putative ABC transport system permease protein
MNWFVQIFRRRHIYDDLAEEMREHLEERTEQMMRLEGVTRAQAALTARKAFGNKAVIEQRSREVWQWPTLESIWSDLRFALRQLRKSPVFSLTIVLLLGLGIGSVTAVFSLVDAVLLRPVPYPDPSSLVIPWNTPPAGVDNGGFTEYPWSPIQYHALMQETKPFRYLGAFVGGSFNLTGLGDPAMLEGASVTWGFFPALGVQPEVGRFFTPEEDSPGHEREVILSDALWRNRFHADPSLLNHIVHLNGAAYTVVGIMPSGFGFPRANEMPGDFTFAAETELWVPMALPAVTAPFTSSELAFVGRLQPGMTLAQAQAGMDLFAEHMDLQRPASKGWNRSHITPLQKQVAGDSGKPLLLILSAVALVLLIVCFNVAGLVLTRSLARQREFTVRAALGAGRLRVLRQLLTESLLLAFAGGAAGMGIAMAGVQLVKVLGPRSLPRLQEADADLRIFAFAFVITLVTGILFGLAPALGAARTNLVESLKEGGQKLGTGTSHPRLRSALVVTQISLALMLVVASGLLVRTFYQLLASDGGFRAEHVLTFQLSLPSTQYPDREAIARFYQRALPGLRSIAGVESAGVTEAVPMGGPTEAGVMRVVGRTYRKGDPPPIVNYTVISPGLFTALGTPILRGRDVLDSDLLSAPPVTIVNRALAHQYWPHEDAIGKRVLVPSQKVPATIIGIVADIKHSSLREVPGPEMFEPYTQDVWPSLALMQVVLRTKAAPDTVIKAARQTIHQIDPGVPVAKVSTLATLTGAAMAGERFSMMLVGCFGLLAVLLAAVGIYGVISYSVAQRTREIGIRVALGAQRGQIFGLIIRHGLGLSVLGILIGLAAALGMGRLLTTFLYGVTATDPLTFVSVSLFLGVIAAGASFLPARRAASIDPVEALRTE